MPTLLPSSQKKVNGDQTLNVFDLKNGIGIQGRIWEDEKRVNNSLKILGEQGRCQGIGKDK